MRITKRRIAAVTVSVVLLFLGGFTLRATLAQAKTTGCRVDYQVSGQTPGDFEAKVTVTNLGDPIRGWQLEWSTAAGQTITRAWDTTIVQTNGKITARNGSRNAALDAGGSASFGFSGSWTTSNPTPTSFTLNGTTCMV